VKTRTGKYYSKDELPEMYHILAVVHLVGNEDTLLLDEAQVFLIPSEQVAAAPTAFEDLGEFAISAGLVKALFAG
jgi:hypothetical protein